MILDGDGFSQGFNVGFGFDGVTRHGLHGGPRGFYGKFTKAAPAVLPDTANGVTFDGSADYLSRAALTGAVDSKSGLLSFWIKIGALPGTTDYLFHGKDAADGNGVFGAYIDSSGIITILGYAPGGVTAALVMVTDTAITADGNWHQITAGWDTATATKWIYVDDVEAQNTGLGGTSDNLLDWTHDAWSIASLTTGGNYFDGSLGEFYLTNETLPDSETTRRKFLSSGGSRVDLGTDGSTPTGTQPLIYESGEADQFALNFGSAGDWTVNGTLASIPIDDLVPAAKENLGAGGGSKRRSKYPRRIIIDGQIYWVNSAAEERALLAKHQAKVEAEALTLAITDAPAKEVKAAKVRVQRVQRRIEAVDNREDEWLARLIDEDDEILAIVLH
tara:strand:+ start:120 stop:1286 length:1167 start_codon:yes stop_codon:yes gene_type:complete